MWSEGTAPKSTRLHEITGLMRRRTSVYNIFRCRVDDEHKLIARYAAR
jgi:hypothetical protein